MNNAGQLWSWSLTAFDHSDLAQAIPELNALRQVVERTDWHDDDAFQQSLHLFEWVQQLPVSLFESITVPETALCSLLSSGVDPERVKYTTHDLLGFAALIHDVGKAQTFRVLPDGSTRCTGHEEAGARMARTIVTRFDFSRTERRYITNLVEAHGKPYALFKETATLPEPQQQERTRCFETDHLIALLLLACGDLVTSQLQTRRPKKYASILDFYQRWLLSALGEEQEANAS
jgi:hypothetical protein